MTLLTGLGTYVCKTSEIGKVARFTTVKTTTSSVGTFLFHAKPSAFLSGIPVRIL